MPAPSTPRRGALPRLLPALLASAVAAVLLLAGCQSVAGHPVGSGPGGSNGGSAGPSGSGPGTATRPNIVFVLTDDLSWNLVRYMPHVQAMERAGTTFTNYAVTDSLCCPSRSAIFTGEYAHDTKVFTNEAPDGGFPVFHNSGDEHHTFATALQAAGYRTGFMGKYMNLYYPDVMIDPLAPGGTLTNYVPPGWSEWDAAGNGYPEYNYVLNENHHLKSFGHRPQDYLVSVMNSLGNKFIADSVHAKRPFLLELSPFSPHLPSVPAPQDARAYPNVGVPHGPSFDKHPRNAPTFLKNLQPLSAPAIHSLDLQFRQRVRCAVSLDRLVASTEEQLVREGQAGNTYFVFSSDNGYHMGEHGLWAGKMTAYDTDVTVPLMIVGPHVPAGRRSPALVQNIDLAPTFEALAGAKVPPQTDGRSIVPLLGSATDVPWRTTQLIEHHGSQLAANDPDYQNSHGGNPPTYAALRTSTYTYVQYANGAHEYYDRTRDPYEMDNIYASLPPSRVHALEREVQALTGCHGATACWHAATAAG